MHRYCIILSLLFFGGKMLAGNGAAIRIQMENTAGDTLLIGRWCGDQIIPVDTIIRPAQGDFLLTADTLLPEGMYALSRPGKSAWVSFLVTKLEQRFAIQVHYQGEQGEATFSGAPENERYQRFNDYLIRRAPERRNLTNALRYLRSKGEDTKYYQQQLTAIQTETTEYARSLADEDTSSVAAALIRARLFAELNSPALADLAALPADRRIVGTPVFFEATRRLLDTYAEASDDSLHLVTDTLLALTEPIPEVQAWYLRRFLEQFAPRGNQPREGVFVHLVRRFVGSGTIVPFSKAEQSQWIKLADRLEPLLLGRKAPALTMPTLNIAGTLERAEDPDERKRFLLDKEVDFLAIEAPYTLLVFWKPDCSHCVESMPKLVELYRQYRDRGLEVVAVCYTDYWGMPDCARVLREAQATEWINTADPFYRTRFYQKYDVTGTPTFFLLGPRKEILLKNISVEQLPGALDRWIDSGK